jgi:hypothetical protein
MLPEKTILSEFCKHFNARLTPLEFVLIAKRLNDISDLSKKERLTLSAAPRVYTQLIEGEYQALLLEIIKNIRIEPSTKDIFSSEIDSVLFEFYKEVFANEKQRLSIVSDKKESSFTVLTSSLFATLIWSPLSQLHCEIVYSFEFFNKIIEAYGGSTSSLFLNANASTAFSYFIQIYTCQCLGISQKPNVSVSIVI